jgi:hypothetical protein
MQKGEQRSNFTFSLHYGRMNMQQWFCRRAWSKASQNNCRTTAALCMPENTTVSQRLQLNTNTYQCQLYSPGQLSMAAKRAVMQRNSSKCSEPKLQPRFSLH